MIEDAKVPEDALIQQKEIAALNMPHQVYLGDRILHLDVGPFTSRLTLGLTGPSGIITPSVSVSCSTELLAQLADKIQQGLKEQSAPIKLRHQEFAKRLS